MSLVRDVEHLHQTPSPSTPNATIRVRTLNDSRADLPYPILVHGANEGRR
jgi:hypothetical protein